MITGFYVDVLMIEDWQFRMRFFHYTDLRFEVDVPIVDAAAIQCWCRSIPYKSKLINF